MLQVSDRLGSNDSSRLGMRLMKGVTEDGGFDHWILYLQRTWIETHGIGRNGWKYTDQLL